METRCDNPVERGWAAVAAVIAALLMAGLACSPTAYVAPSELIDRLSGGDGQTAAAGDSGPEGSNAPVVSDCGESTVGNAAPRLEFERLFRVSRGIGGAEPAGASDYPAISADGRFIAFISWADNLVADDHNGKADVFVHDAQNGETVLVSLTDHNQQADGDAGPARFLAYSPPTTPVAISGDGSVVVFESSAGNMTPHNTRGRKNIFARDLAAGRTVLVSVGFDRAAADSDCSNPSISADGRYVAFESLATNLVPGDTNNSSDVFVRDLQANTTVRVSLSPDGLEMDDHSIHPCLSPDGQRVAFESQAAGAGIVMYDLAGGRSVRAAAGLGLTAGSFTGVAPAISDGASTIAYMALEEPGGPNSGSAPPTVCPRGFLYHAMYGGAALQAGAASIPLVLGADQYRLAEITLTARVALSASGQFAAYRFGRSRIYVHDLRTGHVAWADWPDPGLSGEETDYGVSGSPAISGDGTTVAFASTRANLAPGDTNGVADIYVGVRGGIDSF